jgi:hypothetical protein
MIIEFIGAFFSILGAFLLSRDIEKNPNTIFYAFISFFIANMFFLHMALLEGMAPLLIQQALFFTTAYIGLMSHTKNKDKTQKISLFFVFLTVSSLMYLYFLSGKEFNFYISEIEVLAAILAISGSFLMKTHTPVVRIRAFYLFLFADILYIWIGYSTGLYFFMIQAMFFIYTSWAGILNTQKLISNENKTVNLNQG